MLSLFLGNEKEYKIVKLQDLDSKNIKDLKQKVVKPSMKLHGFTVRETFGILIFETDDNQLDFNELTLKNFEGDDVAEEESYQYIQYSEIIRRIGYQGSDPVQKIQVFSSESIYALALR